MPENSIDCAGRHFVASAPSHAIRLCDHADEHEFFGHAPAPVKLVSCGSGNISQLADVRQEPQWTVSRSSSSRPDLRCGNVMVAQYWSGGRAGHG